ncbi:hypothetical protein VH1807_contig00009-0017 [Vibrio harveyi]|nr:hypothetical protein VH1807_contig00009-0017 [Vibrio harveyi]
MQFSIDKTNEAEQYRQHIELTRDSGVTSFIGIADKLNELGIKTVRGGSFQAVQVKRLVERLDT